MVRRLATLSILLLGTALILFVYHVPTKLEINRKVPSFVLQDEKGESISLDRFIGKVVFLNFWATWCSPCVEEIPSIEMLHKKFEREGLQVIGINRDTDNFTEGLKIVRNFRDRIPFRFPVLYDVEGKAAELYGVSALPVTFLIDREGKLLMQLYGERDWTDQKYLGIIREALENR